MQMQIGVAVRVGDFFIVDFTEPVVCGYCPGIGQNQSAHGIGDGRVFFYPPVGYDINRIILYPRSKIRCYLKGKKIDYIRAVRNACCVKCLGNGVGYTGQIKLGTSAVSFDDCVHSYSPLFIVLFYRSHTTQLCGGYIRFNGIEQHFKLGFCHDRYTAAEQIA